MNGVSAVILFSPERFGISFATCMYVMGGFDRVIYVDYLHETNMI